MNRHKKIENYEKVCRLQELDSYAQGQGHNHVRGQIVPEIVLLINCSSKFDGTLQKDKAKWEGVLCTKFMFLCLRSEVKIMSQQ